VKRFFISVSEEHKFGRLDKLLKFCAPGSSYSTIDNAMIRAESHIHFADNLVGVLAFTGSIIRNHCLLSGRDGQNASLRRIDDRREVVNSEHTQVRNSEGTTRQFSRRQFIFACSSSNVFNFSADLLKALQVDVAENGSHKAGRG